MNDNIDYCHHDSKTLNTNYYQVLNAGRNSGKTFQLINMYEEKYNKLQSNWNSLREWLKNKIDNFQDDVSEPILHEQMTMRVIYEYMENLDKMNELEGKKDD